MKLQKLLIQWILNPLGSKMAAVPQKCRTVGFYLGGAGLFFIYFVRGMDFLNIRYFIPFFLGCLFLGLMLLCTLPKKLHPLRFSPVLSICWFGAGIMMLQAGLRLNTDVFADAIMFLFVYPLLWMIWGQTDLSKIFHMLCNLCRWAFVVFFIVSLLFFPILKAQYPGMFGNVNCTALFVALVLSCLTIELWQQEKHGIYFWFNLVLIGLASAMMFFTNSRTGELAVICAWLFSGGIYIWLNRRQLKKILLGKFLPMILSVLIFLPITLNIFTFVYPVSQSLSETTQKIFFGDDVISTDKPKPETKPTDLGGFFELMEKKEDTDGKTMDAYSTGRISIWKVFAAHTKLFGTEPPHSYYVDINHRNYETAHNTPLEFAIDSGWFCAALYFLFNILAGLKSIQYALKKRRAAYALLPLMVTIAFGGCSMLESVSAPYLYMISMYYFFVQTPLMVSPPAGL